MYIFCIWRKYYNIYTSMYMVSENCNHVLAKYKSWFSPIELK